jgi:hypothetical protein
MLGLCLVAVFALGAVLAAGSASAAEPEWGRCVTAKGGHYANNSCTKEAPINKKTGKFTGKYEWKAGAPSEECVAQKHGEYTNSTCTTKSTKPKKGKFEKISPRFKGEGGAGVLDATFFFCVHGDQINNKFCQELAEEEHRAPDSEKYINILNSNKVECTSESAEGELSGTKEVKNIHVAFHGCHFGSFSCQNTQTAEGEVKVNPLVGEIGYISKANKEVGVVLHPATAGGLFAEFQCGADYVQVGAGPSTWTNKLGTTTEGPWYSGSGNDGIISPVTPVDRMSSTETQEYKTAVTDV